MWIGLNSFQARQKSLRARLKGLWGEDRIDRWTPAAEDNRHGNSHEHTSPYNGLRREAPQISLYYPLAGAGAGGWVAPDRVCRHTRDHPGAKGCGESQP